MWVFYEKNSSAKCTDVFSAKKKKIYNFKFELFFLKLQKKGHFEKKILISVCVSICGYQMVKNEEKLNFSSILICNLSN